MGFTWANQFIQKMKTVLAPNAPWPNKDAKVIAKRHNKEISEKTDLNFEAWVKKQKPINDFLFLKDKK